MVRPPVGLLEAAKSANLKKVLIVGINQYGETYVSSSEPTIKGTLEILHRYDDGTDSHRESLPTDE